MLARRLTPLTLALLLFPLAGCRLLIKQSIDEFKGAQGDVLLINELPDSGLMKYSGVEFEPATTTVGDKLAPPRLLRAYDSHAQEQVEELRDVYPGGAPTLRIASEVLYFQKKGLMSAAECMARVRMRDGDTLIVDALVRAESEAFTAAGEDPLAGACIKALAKFLRSWKEDPQTERDRIREAERKERERERKRERDD